MTAGTPIGHRIESRREGGRVAARESAVAHVDRQTGRATDWPPEIGALFFETAAA